MNPRAVAAWSAACLTIVLTTTNPGYRLGVLAASVTVLLASAGARRARRPLLAASAAGLLGAALNILLSHLGADVLFRLPEWLPAVGGPGRLLMTDSIAVEIGPPDVAAFEQAHFVVCPPWWFSIQRTT